MARIDDLETRVNALGDNSLVKHYENAFTDYVDVLRIRPEPDIDRMIEIINTFRNKLIDNGLPQLDVLDNKARAIHEALVAASVGVVIQGINNRNPALTSLRNKLQVEIVVGNAQSELLGRIKTFVEQATKTIDELRGLVSDLNNQNSGLRTTLRNLLTRAGNITNIFIPGE